MTDGGQGTNCDWFSRVRKTPFRLSFTLPNSIQLPWHTDGGRWSIGSALGLIGLAHPERAVLPIVGRMYGNILLEHVSMLVCVRTIVDSEPFNFQYPLPTGNDPKHGCKHQSPPLSPTLQKLIMHLLLPTYDLSDRLVFHHATKMVLPLVVWPQARTP